MALPQRDGLDLKAYLARQRSTVGTYLDRFLPPSDTRPEIIHKAMRYSVFAGGKRVRPILALATGEALETEFEKLIYLACALEMIHTYSLIHDDLPAMDDDYYRRGKLTTHKKFGEGIAILAGNGLLTHAFQLLGRIPCEREATRLEIIDTICSAIGTEGGLIGGQVMDLITQGKPFSRDQLEYIHSSKTGALIEASIYCASLLSTASAEKRRQLRAYGARVGLSFQVADDLLDVEGSQEQLGKASNKDAQTLKATYPSLLGVEKARQIKQELTKSAVEAISFLEQRGQVLEAIALFIANRDS